MITIDGKPIKLQIWDTVPDPDRFISPARPSFLTPDSPPLASPWIQRCLRRPRVLCGRVESY
jgi:hypothetical protein